MYTNHALPQSAITALPAIWDVVWTLRSYAGFVCGGVAANRYLRKQLYELCHDLNVDIVYPSPKYCTDNGVMVAWAGMERLIHNDYTIPPIPQSSLDRFETLKLKQKEKMNSDGIYEEDQDELLPFYPSWSL